MMHISGRKSHLLACVWVASLCGCSSLNSAWDTPEKEATQPPLTTEDVREYIAQWEAARPQMERLEALEDDLALIVEEVNKHSRLKNLPEQYSGAQITDYLEAEHYDAEDEVDYQNPPEIAEQPVSGLSPEAKEQEVERQNYAVHLALYLQEESARRGWKTLHHRYSQLLGGLTPLVQKINKPEQSVYSLRAGPFDSENAAELLCGYLRNYRYKCATTTFSGNGI